MNDIIWPDHFDTSGLNLGLPGRLTKDLQWQADMAEAKSMLRWTITKIQRKGDAELKFDRPQPSDRDLPERWNEAQRQTNPPIQPDPKLKQEFTGIGPAWLVVAGVAGLVLIYLYVRVVA